MERLACVQMEANRGKSGVENQCGGLRPAASDEVAENVPEPASVTFCYALFTFIWMVVSPWRWKLPAYIALVGLGMFAMPGPTLLLMLVLVLPYMLFLASRH